MTKSALYRFYGESDVLLYVGISQCPFTRSKSHEANASWYGDIRFMEVEWHDTREDAARAERVAIDRERPQHNVVYRHEPRYLAASMLSPKRDVVVDAVPKMAPMQGPMLGNSYSVGWPDFQPEGVPKSHMFGADLASMLLAFKICRRGDIIYVEPGIPVTDRMMEDAVLEGIHVVTS
ncbi:MAG: putative GIY-YIG endonuclease [Prokaryotic dsDNA virus sp.]|nr:MAG: putative GIY-YIG endonuclease [Prokaryotic dsDNA virus sp.]|tara:strand:+ start:43423 stop:43956 length:534 start_codon:yes stop_codon:yes gene_type:complete